MTPEASLEYNNKWYYIPLETFIGLFISWSPDIQSQRILDDVAAAGQPIVSIGDVSPFSVGDWVLIQGYDSLGNPIQEAHVVKEVADTPVNDLTMENDLQYTYEIGKVVKSTSIQSLIQMASKYPDGFYMMFVNVGKSYDS